MANAVRIEKLSDDEDEEVDITDDLSDDGGVGDKPQDVLKTEVRSPGPLTGTGVETESPIHTHLEPMKEEADLTGMEIDLEENTEDQPSYSSLSPQSPQPSSTHPYSEERGETGPEVKIIKTVSLLPEIPETVTGIDSKQRTQEDHIHQGQSSQAENTVQRCHLEEACSDTAGNTHLPADWSLYI